MSEIQVGQINSTDGSTAITTGADGYVSFAKTQIGGRRNLIINGAMQVAQRGTSFTGTGATYRVCDRVRVYNDTEVTLEQSTDAPPGFSYSYKASATANTTDSAGFNAFRLPLESQSTVCSGYGTNDAKPMTLSFWVKSGKTGKNSILFLHHAPSANGDAQRMISKPYTITSADTWEYKSVTIPADTVAFDNDTSLGLSIDFNWTLQSAATGGTYQTDSWANNATANRMPSDQDEFITTNGDYFAITGVQLEVGPLATPFEHRSYGEELLACKRYFLNAVDSDTGSGVNTPAFMSAAYDGNSVYSAYQFPVEMRTNPSTTFSDASDFSIRHSSNVTATNTATQGTTSRRSAGLNWAGSVASGSAGWVRVVGGNNAYVYFDAEL